MHVNLNTKDVSVLQLQDVLCFELIINNTEIY